MFIIQDGVKRSLDTTKPFHIGLSMAEAESIVEQLSFAMEEGGWWITADINPKIKIDPKLDAAAPLNWTDPGNVNLSIEEMRQRSITPEFVLNVEDNPAGFSASFTGGEFVEEVGVWTTDEVSAGNSLSGSD